MPEVQNPRANSLCCEFRACARSALYCLGSKTRTETKDEDEDEERARAVLERATSGRDDSHQSGKIERKPTAVWL
ncbi:hypothetical protein [Natronoglomus mannanivorans]|uniref:Uncharacterized protein n=1 Tax=Natronoglomus mannanivorans TaxID=2979990 RepID=A0AAP3E344_9EURY|nr:hypothetical protein [Halobacteria archaeon AArc-xg1-1]